MTANLQDPNKHGCRSAAKIPTPKPNWTHDGEIIQKHTQMVRRLTLLLQSRTKFDICNAWAKTTWDILAKSWQQNLVSHLSELINRDVIMFREKSLN